MGVRAVGYEIGENAKEKKRQTRTKTGRGEERDVRQSYSRVFKY